MQTPYSVQESETVLEEDHLVLRRETLVRPDGRRLRRLGIYHPGAVVVVPQQEDGQLLVLRQYRHMVRRVLLEFCAGTREPGEDPLACARRELAEETGHCATEWIALGEIVPAAGLCSEVQHAWVARGLTPTEAVADDDECIEVERMGVDAFSAAIASGEVCDAKSIAVFMRARLRGVL